jgi:hypothetical protein
MSWNPSKEVAVARDAAEALDDAPMCVVLWVTKDSENIHKLGMASYGKTKQLCNVANNLGQWCYEAAMKWDGGGEL